MISLYCHAGYFYRSFAIKKILFFSKYKNTSYPVCVLDRKLWLDIFDCKTHRKLRYIRSHDNAHRMSECLLISFVKLMFALFTIDFKVTIIVLDAYYNNRSSQSQTHLKQLNELLLFNSNLKIRCNTFCNVLIALCHSNCCLFFLLCIYLLGCYWSLIRTLC